MPDGYITDNYGVRSGIKLELAYNCQALLSASGCEVGRIVQDFYVQLNYQTLSE